MSDKTNNDIKKTAADESERQPEKASFTGGVITAVSFLAVIFGFAVAGLISPDRAFSDMENRTLQQKPEFSFERLKNGDFTADIEQYMSDQIFLKDELVSVKTAADRMLLKSYLNGVYFGSGGYYLQDFQPNIELVDRNVDKLNSFAETVKGQAEVSFLLAPNAVCVLGDKLPAFNKSRPQEEVISEIESRLSKDINFVCPAEDMKQSPDKDSFYYRTDHHWTADGAYFAFEKLMESMGESVPQVNWQTEELKDFYGTLYSKAPQGTAKPDTIELRTADDNEITVKYVTPNGDHKAPAECTEQEGVLTNSTLFAEEPKTTKDKYATFMGGNFTLIECDTQGENDENVLVIKDSYANSMMPYLCQKYKHISMIDLRYYHMEPKTVSQYVQENNITKVIYLYNVDFINTDNNFAWLD